MMDPDADLSDPVFIHILYLQVKVLVIYFLSFFRQMIQKADHQAADRVIILWLQLQSQAVI